MSGFVYDLRYGSRMLLRSPGFTIVAIAILALGIGANSAIFSIINAVLLRPLPYGDPSRLFELTEINEKGNPAGVPLMDREPFAQRGNVFDDIAFWHWQNLTLTGPEGPENAYGAKVSDNSFRMLGVRPVLGRGFRPEEFRPGAPGAVILSDRLWQRRYGRDRSVIGQQVMLNGQAHVVAGVMGPEFFFPQQRFEYWTPWQFTAAETGSRDSRFQAIARLRAGVTPERARAEAEAVLQSAQPEDVKKGWKIQLIGMGSQQAGQVRPILLVLLGAVGFVLLISCLNVANLLLARATGREREMAVRASLGAGRFRVVRQLLTENALLAGAGGLVGLLLSGSGSRALIAMFPDRIPLPNVQQMRMDSTVLLFTLGLSLATAVVFGLIPALHASRTNLQDALKEGGRNAAGSSRSHRVRGLLVIVETALSLILATGAGLMLRSLDRLLSVDPGFRPDRVLTLRIPPPPAITANKDQMAYYGRVLERVESVPGLNAVGLITPMPLSDVDANATFMVEGRAPAPGEFPLVKLRCASPGYFRSMGISLRRGRVFTDADGQEAPKVAVVNEALVRRYFSGDDPIGKRVTMSLKDPKPEQWFTVIGVVNDVKFASLGGEPRPEMYRPLRQFLAAPFAMTVIARTSGGEPARMAATVQREIRAINPDQPVTDVLTMNAVVSRSVAQPRFYTALLGVFALIALALAAVGLYGVLACTVTQRSHELGIRMALGAPRTALFRHVVGQALVLAGAGVVLGLAGAWGLTRLIAAQLYNVKPTDAATYAAVSAMLLGVAAAASYVPARRATLVDPAVALRCE